MRIRSTMTVLRILSRGISVRPLEVTIHKKIILTALGIIRRDGHANAYLFYRENLKSLQSGSEWADSGEASRQHMGSELHQEAMSRFHNQAKVAAAAKDYELALMYLGAATHILQDAGVPLHNAARLIIQGDVYEEYITARYSPTDHRRAKTGAIVLDEPREYIRHIQQTLHNALLQTRNRKGVDRHDAISASVLSVCERLTAGYLIYFYEKVIAQALEQKSEKSADIAGDKYEQWEKHEKQPPTVEMEIDLDTRKSSSVTQIIPDMEIHRPCSAKDVPDSEPEPLHAKELPDMEMQQSSMAENMPNTQP